MLEFKKISEDTAAAMKEAVNSDADYYSMTVNCINNLIPSDEVHVLNSANSCLITLAECICEPILVCDMGGWNGFIRSCDVFGKSVEYLDTDDGVVNIEILKEYLEKNAVSTLYITSFAGYSAPQPLKDIQELCDVHNVLLIVDISGSVGDREVIQYGDILVSSTGSPKIVNIENGGFICKRTDKIELNKHLLKSLRADNITCAGISNEMVKARDILEKTIEMNKYLKDKLKEKNLEVIHPDSYGLNTIIIAESKSNAKKIAYNIRQQMKIDGNIITTGPNYNRIKKACIILETKNLNIESVTYEDMDNICDIIIRSSEKN